jgi:pilus assembly protein CpaE
LAFENDIEVVAVAGNGKDAVEAASQYQPNVVLMDINMPDMDGITAAELVVRAVPIAQVIMVSVQSEADYLRRAMLVGARDFVTKPFSAEELISTIRRVHKTGLVRAQAAPPPGQAPTGPWPGGHEPMRPKKEGKVVAVFGTKGGIGTSMVAVNLAIGLSRMDHKVAVVDASLHFGDVGVLLNLQATRSIADIIPVFADLDADLIESMLTPHASGIKTLLAPGRPEMAELVTAGHIKSILAEMRRMFDFIVVDTTRSLQDDILAVLDAADRIVLLGATNIPSIKNARAFFEIADALSYTSEKIMFVLNKVDRRSVISAKDIETHIKHPVAAQLPMDEATAVSSVNKGVPFVADPRTKSTALAQAVLEVADRLTAELEPVEEIAAAALSAPVETPEDAARKRLGRLFSRA